MFSETLLQISKELSKICLVAMFEFKEANFCNPTNESLSGVDAALALLNPITSNWSLR